MAGRMLYSPRVICALAIAVGLLAPRAGRGAWDCGACPGSSSTSSVLYQLMRTSSFEVGCLDPCACPILMRNGLSGSFVLVPYRSDPLFAEYLLCGIDWNVPASGPNPGLRITGEGWYRVGGEVAIQQELRLCVSVNGGEIQRFESGLVSGGGRFPDIDIAAATSGFFCWDSVVALKAAPATTGVPPGTIPGFGIRARPNPSTGPVDFEVFVSRSAVVSISILDVEGRAIRTLERGVRLPPGGRLFHWDGTRSDGSPAAAGLYLVRLEADGATRTESVIRLR